MPLTVHARSYGWGFRRNSNHLPPDIGILAREIEGTSSYYLGNTSRKEVYLTFDAGYDNGNLAKMLDILRERKVRSTFFITGDMVIRFPELTKQLSLDGHIVASHTHSHHTIYTLSEDELKQDLDRLATNYYNLTGKPIDPFFRPPKGEFDHQSLLAVKKFGYKTIFWSLAYRDWNTDGQRGSDYSFEQVMNNLHNGAIILLHTVSQDNCDALVRIIDSIREQVYEFKTVDQLA
jgi:peptidoglycan-N-acetylmuramic acid deacetylase